MSDKLGVPADCVGKIPDGATLMMGGFGVCGIPENLIRLLVDHGAKDLTIVSNNAGVADFGVGLLINHGQVRRMVSTYVGENPVLEKAMIEGSIEVQLVPQGTFAERIRAGGVGIAGFYTPTGVGTLVEEGKEKRVFDGREYLLEAPLLADFAFVKAWRGDSHGNLVYRMTARNFNPMMAMAAKHTFAEVEELVEPGALDPEMIATPGVFVETVFQGEIYEKRIEKRVHRQASGA
ncbi:MAG: CoA transferase subunit A [Gemmatimonadota bacterium]|jgi:3-oxoacid CoA-transferase subunit A|nr:succinyl-CoA--3-ketoacid-CoA transferase [Gemmatimonadota bacterium]MDP6460996.1 CoA transferase subunit A [Gemmatimonadota bacterium]MDP6530144.1 CoA transferase subunit A [Gemmatimonadota bacterium]MDP6803371.1 CoA transferase subunit A [Gemmatimonadota bacterium]MDP7032771.1 CoA transferase subunit A [Gemmatimonadota bacterium]